MRERCPHPETRYERTDAYVRLCRLARMSFAAEHARPPRLEEAERIRLEELPPAREALRRFAKCPDCGDWIRAEGQMDLFGGRDAA